MLDLPASIVDYIFSITVENRSLAYLFVRKDGRLSDWGGKLAEYGIRKLQKGGYVGEQIFFLEGLLPLDDSSIFLSCLKTEYGSCADIHIFSGDEGDWVLMLDATVEEKQRSLIQQPRNELSLLQEKNLEYWIKNTVY